MPMYQALGICLGGLTSFKLMLSRCEYFYSGILSEKLGERDQVCDALFDRTLVLDMEACSHEAHSKIIGTPWRALG